MKAVLDHLVLDRPLSWQVTERVVAEWTDGESDRQGQFGSLNTMTNPQSEPTLTLAVGHHEASLLVVLHVAVKLRPSSSSSKPKHMFVVLPIESLADTPVCTTLDANQVPNTTLAALLGTGRAKRSRADGSSDTQPAATTILKRVIKMHVQLKKPGYVIMPRVTITREVKGSPRNLLEDIHSLSKSLSFDIYLRFNTYAMVGLQDAMQMLRKGLATTPTIHVHRMFQCASAVDEWNQFLLPPCYQANCPEDKRSPVRVLVPRSVEPLPSYSLALANDEAARVEETPPPPPPRFANATSPRPCKRKATSPPPVDDDEEAFCALLYLWIKWAWSIVPDAHHIVFDQLVKLGRAVRAADRTAMASLRAQCSKCILLTAADRSLAAGSSKKPQEGLSATTVRDLESEFQDLIQWINRANSLADMTFSSKLCAMAKAVRLGDISTFDDCKAECVIRVIVL